jgi:hypothetical protein
MTVAPGTGAQKPADGAHPGAPRTSKIPFRSHSGLFTLVVRACAIDGEFATESDPIARGQTLHRDALALQTKVYLSITGLPLKHALTLLEPAP